MKVPRLPLGHPIAGLRSLNIDEDNYIWEVLKEAGARAPGAEDDEDLIFRTEGYFARLDADIARVVNTYLTAKYFELRDPSYSRFREDLLRMREALNGVPSITSPVWPAIEEHAGEGAAEVIAELRAAVEKVWKKEGIGSRTGAPTLRAKHQLVRQLYRLFEKYTGHEPKPGSEAFGRFESFVEEAERQTQDWLNQRNSDDAEAYKFASGIEKSLRKK